MGEWLKPAVLKTVSGKTRSGVGLPLPPPLPVASQVQEMHDVRQRCRELLANAGPIAALTGAGISAESGIPTFRGAGGLWRSHRAEDLATPQGFARDPRLVWE